MLNTAVERKTASFMGNVFTIIKLPHPMDPDLLATEPCKPKCINTDSTRSGKGFRTGVIRHLSTYRMEFLGENRIIDGDGFFE